ncbi:T9SS type A sorting domain-containing protein [Ekhidna sp.]|uniref:T9SS type A sorting domain-containing protein n=1 Tax=Ekhidna sp. TaxID=2608089 RepID=UPI0035111A2C
MRYSLIILTLGVLASVVNAQEVISSQGDSYSQVNGSIDFTIGEVVTNTLTGDNGYLTQGFHQSTLTISEVLGYQEHEISIFPNPSMNVLYINSSEFKDVDYTLYDSKGKIVLQSRLSESQTQIQVHELGAGVYSLILRSESSILKSFKIIKSNN